MAPGLFSRWSRLVGWVSTCRSTGPRKLLPVTVMSSFPHLTAAPTVRGALTVPSARPVDARTQRRRRVRLARTLVRVSVRSALLPRGATRSRQRLRVCSSADILTALDVRVQVVGGAVPWPRLGRVVVSDSTGWLGDLAVSTAAPGTPVLGRGSPRALPVDSVACPVVLRYRTAGGYLDRHEIPETVAEVTAARDLVVEVHRLPALLPAGSDPVATAA